MSAEPPAPGRSATRVLQRGQQVALTLGSEESLVALVADVAEDGILLTPGRDVDPFWLDRPTEVDVAFCSPFGVHSLRGPLRRVGERIHFEPLGEGVLQRREQFRVPAVVAVGLRPFGGGPPIVRHTIDISGGGALIADPQRDLVPGRHWVSLALGEADPPLEVLAVIESRSGGREKAACFEALGRRDQDRLVRFVFEQQRLRRRQGLR